MVGVIFMVCAPLFCAQTGFIQIGEESLFIEPLDENDPLESFFGLKHRLLRQRRSAKNSSAPQTDQPSYCGTVHGKCQRQPHWMAHTGLYPHQCKIKLYWSQTPWRHAWYDIIFTANTVANTIPNDILPTSMKIKKLSLFTHYRLCN